MRKYLATVFLFFIAICSVAAQDELPVAADSQASVEHTEALILKLRNINQLQGNFEQVQFTDRNAPLVQSSGRFRLLRPGYFSWEITAPDSQLIIADPDFLWHWDRDLETVTRRPVTNSAQMSPLQVLGGDEAALREKFEVSRPVEEVFALTPRPDTGDPGFQRLSLQLTEEGIRGMEIIDKLGQRVVISFTELDSTTVLTPGDFAFTPPEDVDQFFYDE